MKLNHIKPAKGSVKNRKRVGRGRSSGQGKTSGRGHNGAQSRSGYSRKIGFEGGQMPLQKRVPKYGFKNPNRVEFTVVNLELLQKLADEKGLSDINPQVLIENGVVAKKDKVKVLGNGELKTKMNVQAHKFSASAKKAIEDQGGKAEIV